MEVAALAGLGLDDLEEALLLQAELLELRASRSRRAEAVVIEAKMDRGQGPVATVVVKRGSLKARSACLDCTLWWCGEGCWGGACWWCRDVAVCSTGQALLLGGFRLILS